MTKRRRTNPRLRRAWNKRPKYMPSFTNMKEYTNMSVHAGANLEELMKVEPVVWHDSLLMLKKLGGFHQGLDKWHRLDLPWLFSTDRMYFHGDMFVFFRRVGGLTLRTGIYKDFSKEKAKVVYFRPPHWFIPYKEKEESFQDDLTGLKPNPIRRD